MLQKKKRRTIMLLVVLLMSSMTVNAAAPVLATSNSIRGAKNEKSTIEKKKKAAQELLDKLESEKDDLINYIKQLDGQLDDLNTQIEALNGQITQAQAELEVTKAELEEAKRTVAEQYDIMKKRIKYMYENGNSDYLDLFLEARSMSDLLNQAEYMSKISEYDNQLLDRYKDSQNQVAIKERNLETELASLEQMNEELEVEQDTVQKLVEAKSAEVAKYEDKIDKSDAAIVAFNKQLEEQEKLIEQLLEQERKRLAEEAAKNNNSTGNTTVSMSGFLWPCPSSTRITSKFGMRSSPTAGASTYHRGIDIGAASGSNIVAAKSGTVVTATYNWSQGNYIMLSHGGELYTVYMHASKLLVSVGDTVSQGDVIALVGSTGVSTGPHLHFGINVNEAYVDPLKYVSN